MSRKVEESILESEVSAMSETVSNEKETTVAEQEFVPKKKNLWDKIKSFEEKGGENWEKKREEFLLKLQGRKVYQYTEESKKRGSEDYLILKGGVDIEANGDAIFVLFDEDGNEKGEKAYNLNKVGYRDYKEGAPKDPKETVVFKEKNGKFVKRTTEGEDPKKLVKYSSGGKTVFARAVEGRPDPSRKSTTETKSVRGPEVELDAPESLVETKEFNVPEQLMQDPDEDALLEELARAEIAKETKEEKEREVERLRDQIMETPEAKQVEVLETPIEMDVPKEEVKKSAGGFKGWLGRRWKSVIGTFKERGKEISDAFYSDFGFGEKKEKMKPVEQPKPELPPMPEPKRYNMKNRYNDLSNMAQEETARFEQDRVVETEKLQEETVKLVKGKEERLIAEEFGKREEQGVKAREDVVISGQEGLRNYKKTKEAVETKKLGKPAKKFKKETVSKDVKEFGEGVEETEEEAFVKSETKRRAEAYRLEKERILNSNDPYEILGVANGASFEEARRAYKSLDIRYFAIKRSGEESGEELYSKIQEAYNQIKASQVAETKVDVKNSAADTKVNIVLEEPKVEKEPEVEYEGLTGAEITKEADRKVKEIKKSLSTKSDLDDVEKMLNEDTSDEGGDTIKSYPEGTRMKKIADTVKEIKEVRKKAKEAILNRKKKKS